MLQFLNPLWLLAIGAIIIPLAIHLWNVRKGKTLKIGSIRLFGENAKQSSRSLRFQDLWLLLLRCLLLILLAVLLAAPFLIERASPEKVKGWILLDKNHLQESYHAFKPKIDSLLRLGFQTRYFNPGFPEFSLADTAKMETADQRDSISSLSYWSLARALDDQLPEKFSAYIVTNNRLNRFTGNRPFLRSNITWATYAPADSVFNKIAAAYMTQRDSLRVVLRQYRKNVITHSLENTSFDKSNPAYEMTGQTGIRYKPLGSLNQYMDTSVSRIDTATIRIALYTDKHPADMAYVKAALEAIQHFSQRRMSVRTYRDPGKLPDGLNWLFWLSETPIAKETKARIKNIFRYETGKTSSATRSTMLVSDRTVYPLENIQLFMLNSTINSEGSVIWDNESGRSVLVEKMNGSSVELKFFSRFDPEWNDLVWSPRFPEVLMELLVKQPDKTWVWEADDRRVLADAQIKPAIKDYPALSRPEGKTPKKMLDQYLWLLLMALFALERWVSYKQKPIAG